ncbi:MAG: hypothetical protein EBR82_19220 [Caulobacteraceae bacterium]|nr:hypothetical protein [Caulobacteraceae bacterium]
MEDNEIEVAEALENTQLVPDRPEPEHRSIRSALEQQMNNLGVAEEEETFAAPAVEQVQQEVQAAPQPEQQVAPLLPPADMNWYEKKAYLNPTPENAYILQQYLNRRAYETRSDYQRKMQEFESLKSQTESLYNTIKEHEDFYARDGKSLTDVARRSITWDRAMREDPINTAIEWLSSYGVNINDLNNYGQYQPEQQVPAEYLTRDEAERIAEEKFQAIQNEQQQKAVEYYNQRAVESFKSNKPVFRDPETAAQLEADMTPVVAALTSTGKYSSPEEILETAYNYVINGNPTYSTIARTMSAKTEIKEQQAAVAKAKTASRSISGSPGSGTPTIQAKNLRDNLLRRLND